MSWKVIREENEATSGEPWLEEEGREEEGEEESQSP